jgi:hypothetical protein
MRAQYRRYRAPAELGGFQLFLKSLRPPKVNIGAALNQLVITGDSLADLSHVSYRLVSHGEPTNEKTMASKNATQPIDTKRLIKNNSRLSLILL